MKIARHFILIRERLHGRSSLIRQAENIDWNGWLLLPSEWRPSIRCLLLLLRIDHGRKLLTRRRLLLLTSGSAPIHWCLNAIMRLLLLLLDSILWLLLLISTVFLLLWLWSAKALLRKVLLLRLLL